MVSISELSRPMTCASLLCSATETMKFNYRTSHALTSIHDRAHRGKTPARSMKIDWTISLLVMKPGRRPPNVSSDHKSKHYQRARFGQYCVGKNVRVCKCVRGDFSIMKCTYSEAFLFDSMGQTRTSPVCSLPSRVRWAIKQSVKRIGVAAEDDLADRIPPPF